MEWTKQKLAHYIGNLRTVIEFKGITEEGLERVFRQEAVRRLDEIEAIIYNGYLSNEEKLSAIEELLEMP